MNHSIPTTALEISALGEKSITAEITAIAIASVVQIARQQGKTLEDLEAEILEDHSILDRVQRHWLKELVTKTWYRLSDA